MLKSFLDKNPPTLSTTTLCNNGFLCWLALELDYNSTHISKVWKCDLASGKFTCQGNKEQGDFGQNVFWKVEASLSIDEIISELN